MGIIGRGLHITRTERVRTDTILGKTRRVLTRFQYGFWKHGLIPRPGINLAEHVLHIKIN